MAQPRTSFEPWEAALIDAARVAHLVTIAADGRPTVVPACFAWQEGRFAIPVDEKPKRPGKLARVRNIERDPRVSLLVDHYDEDWRRLAWVRVEGTAGVVERGELRPELVAALRLRYRQYGAMALERLPLIVIEAERVVSWRWE